MFWRWFQNRQKRLLLLFVYQLEKNLIKGRGSVTQTDRENTSSPVQILLLQMFSSAVFRLAGGETFKYELRRLKTQKVFPVQGQLLRKNSWLILQGAFETSFFNEYKAENLSFEN